MRLLIDANLSPQLCEALSADGHQVVHAVSVGLASASDEAVLQWAAAVNRVVVTADADFGGLLASQGAAAPSVILLRGVQRLTAEAHLEVLRSGLANTVRQLQQGAIVTLVPGRTRVRRLTIR